MSTTPNVNAPKAPSVILAELKAILAQPSFLQVLENLAYPILDGLPEPSKSTLSNILAALEREASEPQVFHETGYEKHKKRLDDAVRALHWWRRVRKNASSTDGMDKLERLVGRIADEVLEWLPALWRVAIEDGQGLDLIRRCLVLCTEAIGEMELACDDALGSSRGRFVYPEAELTVQNSKDGTVFEEGLGRVSDALHWMWRELWVAAVARGASTHRDIESDIDRLRIRSGVYEFFRTDEQDEHPTGYDFWDHHWTPAMQDAASRILASRPLERFEFAS